MTVRTEIKRVFDRSEKAWQQKDLHTLTGLMAPDFVFTSLQGERTGRAAEAEKMQSTMGMVHSFSRVHFTLEHLTVKGRSAIATVTERFSGVSRPMPNGEIQQADIAIKAQCLWQKGNDGWHVHHARELPGSVFEIHPLRKTN